MSDVQYGSADYWKQQFLAAKKPQNQLLQDAATQSVAAQAFQAAQSAAQQAYLETGGQQQVVDNQAVDTAKDKVLDSYVTSVSPGYTLLGGGSKTEVAPAKTYQIPVEDSAAKDDALRQNYASFQDQNNQLQQIAISNAKIEEENRQSKKAYADSVRQIQQQASDLGMVAVPVERDPITNTATKFELRSGANTQSQTPNPEAAFSPNIPEQIWRGTVGYVGNFVGDIFKFNSEHTTGNYSLGAKKTAEVVRDAVSLDNLGNIAGALGFKDEAQHAKQQANLERGQVIAGGISEFLAQGYSKTGYAKDDNTDSNLAAIQQARETRPIEYAIATAVDVAPAVLGFLGRGGSPKVSGASKPSAVNGAEEVSLKPTTKTVNSQFSSFDDIFLNLGSSPTKQIAVTKPFTNEPVSLGNGAVKVTQNPPFKNVTINLGRSTETGLANISDSGSGSGPSGSSSMMPKFTPSKNLKPEDFGFREVPKGDGTVQLEKLEDLTKIKPQKQKPAEPSQKSDISQPLIGHSVEQQNKSQYFPNIQTSRQFQKSKTKSDLVQLQQMVQRPIEIAVLKTSQTKKAAQRQRTSQKQDQIQLFQQTPVQRTTTRQKQSPVQTPTLGQLLSTIQTTKQPTSTTPTFGQTQKSIQIPGFATPQKTRNVPSDPWSRLVTRTPPPPAQPRIRIEPPKLPGGGGGIGLLGLNPRGGRTNTRRRGVNDLFFHGAFELKDDDNKFNISLTKPSTTASVFGKGLSKSADVFGLPSRKKGKKNAFGGLL